jgi:glycosyltransferase involved in cell wall biosynthesis
VRVCYFGTYREEYPRNRILIEGLRRNGVDVVECHEPLWRGIEDRVRVASGGWRHPSFVLRLLRAYWRLLRSYLATGGYDVMVVGYPGQLDVFLARLLTRLRRRPLVLDVFMSLYLVASERGLVGRHPLTGWLLRRLERRALSLPDRLVLDTAEYVAWFEMAYGIAPERFRLVRTGADDRVFGLSENGHVDGDTFHVVYHGTFIPNHGVETIVAAAGLLAANGGFCFELIGRGPERARAMALARRHRPSNVTFVDWLGKEELVERVARADVCLGAFGSTPQSLMTVHGKVLEGLAMGKPVVTGDSPAMRAAMRHGEHVYLVARDDPRALAGGLHALRSDPALRRRLGKGGHDLFVQRYAPGRLGERLKAHLVELTVPPAGGQS